MWWNVLNPVGAIYPLIFYHVSTTINHQHQKCCCNIMSVGVSHQRLGIAGCFQLRESSVRSIVQGLYGVEWSQSGCCHRSFDILQFRRNNQPAHTAVANKHQGPCLHEQQELCTCLQLVASLICYSLKDSRLGYGYDERHHHFSTILMQQVTNRCSPMVVIWHNSEATGSTAWSKWP